ncbi:Nse4 C-terminal-domain-containing protein [Mycena leptocephala]|nr:Nse4 C-terminal-domain-containing protein [Mycena leptocephala]
MASPRKEGLVYDPDQDADIKRAIRRKYRALQKAIGRLFFEASYDENLTVVIDDPLADYTPEELETKVAEANELFEDGGFASASYAILFNLNPDGQHQYSEGARTQVRHRCLQHEDFVTRLVGFMGGYKPPEEVSSEASDVKRTTRRLIGGKWVAEPWLKVGACQQWDSSRQFEKNKKDETRPQEIRRRTLRDQKMRRRKCCHVATVLEQVEKINLFKLVINPESFAQSVENIFYLSFLIRDAKVAFEISEDDEPLVFAAKSPRTKTERRGGILLKQQLIFEFDMATWKRAIEVSKLPSHHPHTTAYETRLGSQWYG